MRDPTNERKIEHIRIIDSDAEVDRRRHYFDEFRLRHRALPEVNLRDIDPSLTFMEKRLSFPLLISSMTGGDHQLVRTINRNLAQAAEKAGVAMGVGSQRVMFINEPARSSFALREFAPRALLFANLGAVQLNYGFTIETCQAAVDVLGADALYFHLNPLQEAVQPEGDTNFSGVAWKIKSVANALPVPLILKEVGAGISPADVEMFRGTRLRYVDVAGTGGTSWSRIEHHRREEGKDGLGILFQDWGIPTPLALQLLKPYRDEFTLIASGGIRTGIDMVKAVILGARLCGLAAPFLKPATESPEAVVAVIERLRREFVTAMFLMGIYEFDSLFGNEDLILR
jgi:isopentenyl-diphosphate delta-isomerase